MSLTQAGKYRSIAFFFRLSSPLRLSEHATTICLGPKNNIDKLEFHILLGIKVIVEFVLAINQLLQFCGELLSDYRLIQQLLRGRLGFILLTTAPDHCKYSMVWSVMSYVVVFEQNNSYLRAKRGEIKPKGVYNMKKVKGEE